MDDELFGAAVDTAMPAQSDSPVKTEKTLRDVIIPLKIQDLFSEHFAEVMSQNSDCKANVFVLGYQHD